MPKTPNPAPTRKIRAVLAGAGYVSWYHARALLSLDFVDLAGVCDIDLQKAERLAATFGIACARTRLNELESLAPDVVHILTPPASHCELALEALRMGCHAFVEKPMAQTSEECTRMITAFEKAGRVLSVNHSARLDPVVVRVLDLVHREHVCGDIVSVDIRRSSDYPPYAGGALPPQYASGGYPFRDMGVHALYLLEAFLGEIKELDVRYLSRGHDPLLAFDEWHGLAECSRGIGRFHLSWNVRPMQNQIIICGTRGVISSDCYLQTWTMQRRIPAPKAVEQVYNSLRNSVATIGSVTANVSRIATRRLRPSPGIHAGVCGFYGALRNGTALPVPAEEGRRIVAWTEKAARDADEAQNRLLEKRMRPVPPSRILVTGASGFVGRALVAKLVREGESPRLLLRTPSPELEALTGVTAVYGDLGNPEHVDRAVAGTEIVFHAGAAMKGSAEHFECATVWGTRNLIESCLKHGVKKLVHVSSVSVVDHAAHGGKGSVSEPSPLEPYPERRGHYTRTKLLAEQMILSAIKDRGLRAVILRPGMIFGPGQKLVAPSGVVAAGSRWLVLGSGQLILPLIYIDDVVDALLLAARQEKSTGQIFQIGDRFTITQRQYIELCKQLPDERLRVVYVPRILFYGMAVVAEFLSRLLRRTSPLTVYKVRSLAPLSRLDTTRARTVLGWTPSVGVQEGLRRTFRINTMARALSFPTITESADYPSATKSPVS